ncbi:MAG TPA: hypothetical protein VHC67_00195 [Gaiellaceae bacterium]|jgi:hypothetical protein|nr:hypothetical protein [Gaiellaceae bacterium]
MRRGRPAGELLRLPVRLHGIQLGRPLDAFVAADANRVLGFEVLCGDEATRFLPFAVARIGDEEISIDSALTLIDERDVEFYARRSRRLTTLGFAEPWVDEDGVVSEARTAA